MVLVDWSWLTSHWPVVDMLGLMPAAQTAKGCEIREVDQDWDNMEWRLAVSGFLWRVVMVWFLDLKIYNLEFLQSID